MQKMVKDVQQFKLSKEAENMAKNYNKSTETQFLIMQHA
jgi:hypothetical protein